MKVIEKVNSSVIADSLLKAIEELREEMHQVAMDKGFADPKVLTISQNLDEKLNQYNRIQYGKYIQQTL